MRREAFVPYSPLGTLKVFANEVWIADGPEIRMSALGFDVPFPTRMTVVRLPSGQVWVHSPIAWSDAIGSEISKLGPVGHLVAPSRLHYWHMPDWQARFPGARSYGPAGLDKTARRPVSIDETLGEISPVSWGGSFEQCLVTCNLLAETDFFHRPSRTLILTDLIENFEPARIRSTWLRLLIKASGAAHPDGKAPIDMRWSFLGRRRKLRAAVERMITWAPERIVVSHGRCYESDATAELRRAFRWVL